MNRRDYYYNQLLSESELDDGFEQAEEADRAVVADNAVLGVVKGGTVTQHSPTADLTVDLVASVAYDQQGQRLFIPSTQTINCALDHLNASTNVAGGGNSKIVSIFAYFDRALSDPRVDGNSNTVYFVRNETFKFYLVQSAEASSPVAPALQSDKILIADITRTFGQTQILNGQISTARQQVPFASTGSLLSVTAKTAPDAVASIVSQVNSLGTSLATTAALNAHTSSTTAHTAAHIVNTPAGTIAATDVQAALNELDTEKLALGGGHVTGATTFDDITLSGSAKLKYATPRSYPLYQKLNFKTNDFGNPGIWQTAFNGGMRQIAADTNRDSLFMPLDLPNGATITRVDLYVNGPTHSGTFANLVKPNVALIRTNESGLTSLGNQSDASANASAYDADHAISIVGLSHVVDKTAGDYKLDISGEDAGSGIIFVAGLSITAVKVTYTMAAADDGAS